MRHLYFVLRRAKSLRTRIRFTDLSALFYTRTPRELRLVEIPFEKGPGNEGTVLSELVRALRPGDVVYDVGANIGVHTIFMAMRVGPGGMVVAIEPDPPSFASLRNNTDLNGLDHVRSFQVAFGSEPASGFLSRFRVSRVKRERDRSLSVRIVRGDDLIAAHGLPAPQVVKIDVEGHEYHVLAGMERALRSDACRLVCCEIHPPLLPDGVSVDDILGILRDCGYIHTRTHRRPENFHVIASKSPFGDEFP
jgi:FkbM family methyltransferase